MAAPARAAATREDEMIIKKRLLTQTSISKCAPSLSPCVCIASHARACRDSLAALIRLNADAPLRKLAKRCAMQFCWDADCDARRLFSLLPIEAPLQNCSYAQFCLSADGGSVADAEKHYQQLVRELALFRFQAGPTPLDS